MATGVRIEVALGDAVDRVTILDLKAEKLTSPEARAHVAAERSAVLGAWAEAGLPDMASLADWTELCAVNRALWDVEDALRDCEAAGAFDAAFVAHARSVYRLNDRRAALKRAINVALGSRLVEVKSYGSAGGLQKPGV